MEAKFDTKSKVSKDKAIYHLPQNGCSRFLKLCQSFQAQQHEVSDLVLYEVESVVDRTFCMI